MSENLGEIPATIPRVKGDIFKLFWSTNKVYLIGEGDSDFLIIILATIYLCYCMCIEKDTKTGR